MVESVDRSPYLPIYLDTIASRVTTKVSRGAVTSWHNTHYDPRRVQIIVCISLLWQKEASDKRDISCNRAKFIRHFH